MPTERELKFSLLDPPPARAELVAAMRGSPFALEPRGTRTHVDRYHDDADGSLRRAGVALRRRHDGAREVAALKTRGRVAGAAHERDEIEGDVADDAWPDAILEALAERAGTVAAEGLAARVEIVTGRTAYDVVQGDRTVAQLVFDDVEARYPGSERSAHFAEAEIEARGDTPVATLQEIAERLDRIVRLTPSSATKLQRAEAVLTLGEGL